MCVCSLTETTTDPTNHTFWFWRSSDPVPFLCSNARKYKPILALVLPFLEDAFPPKSQGIHIFMWAVICMRVLFQLCSQLSTCDP